MLSYRVVYTLLVLVLVCTYMDPLYAYTLDSSYLVRRTGTLSILLYGTIPPHCCVVFYQIRPEI